MNLTRESEHIRLFIKRYANIGLLSTGAKLVDFSDDLYNVAGSTDDPREVPENKGVTWKKLFFRFTNLAEASCYVTNYIPEEESSHPDFSVGGHMTPNSNGIVSIGELSYLMPLCKWHNNTNRNGQAFKHTETRMVELTGFMEGDSVVTFALRLPSEEKYSFLFLDRNKRSWDYTKLSEEKAFALKEQLSFATADIVEPAKKYVLFERRNDRYYVVGTNLSLDKDRLTP